MTIEKRAYILKVDGYQTELKHQPTLKEAQEIVGGYIEVIRCNSIPVKKMVVDEDARIKTPQKPINIEASKICNQGISILGDVIILEGWRSVR